MTVGEIISLCALCVAALMLIVNTYNVHKSQAKAEQERQKDGEKELKEDTAQQTGIMIALDNIKNMLTDIKVEINTVRLDTKDNHDRIIIAEQSLKSEHKRIDTHEDRLNHIEDVLRDAAAKKD